MAAATRPGTRRTRGTTALSRCVGVLCGLVALGASAQGAAPATAPPPPGPLGVFGVDLPAARKLVVALTPTVGNFSDIRIGTRTVSNERIVTTVPFFLNPRQPVRIVPQNIAFRTLVLGAAYGVSPDFGVVVNAGVIKKSLVALVFGGEQGTVPLTRNRPETASLTDVALNGVYRVYQDGLQRVQLSLGFSLPTGNNVANFDRFVLPDGNARRVRAFYGMQLGTGTYDWLPGVVYAGNTGPWSWGGAYRGRFPFGPNDEDYRWGDLHELHGWGGYTWLPGLTTTLRASASFQGPIRGFDARIRGPAVPANPRFYGGERAEIFAGATISGRFIGYDAWTLGLEGGVPVHQDLNGPQIMKDWQASAQLRVKF